MREFELQLEQMLDSDPRYYSTSALSFLDSIEGLEWDDLSPRQKLWFKELWREFNERNSYGALP